MFYLGLYSIHPFVNFILFYSKFNSSDAVSMILKKVYRGMRINAQKFVQGVIILRKIIIRRRRKKKVESSEVLLFARNRSGIHRISSRQMTVM